MALGLDISTFETLNPSRFISFTFPNPSPSNSTSHQLLRFAVLDSPTHTADPLRVAAMFVPEHRESDWIFSTEPGHIQLILSSPGISRLILVGNEPSDVATPPAVYHRPLNDPTRLSKLEQSLKPLFFALSPKSCFTNGVPDIPILSYEDDLISSVTIEICVGPFVGEMLVEDVELESVSEVGESQRREFRRRLRFKRMPNLVQTEIRLLPEKGFDSNCAGIAEMEFRPEIGVLVHPYLVPMVASLALVSSHIEEQIRDGFRPKALCVGVGGGAQLTFLRNELGFEVVGIEADEEVFRVARRYFGMEDGDFIQVWVRDAIDVIKELAQQVTRETSSLGNGGYLDSKFDVMMVDLDTSDAINGVSAPPLEFVQKDTLLAARLVLCDSGIFVMNVIPPNQSFYQTLIHQLQQVFQELYEIDVGNRENFVLIATILPVVSSIGECENSFLAKLRRVISGAYIDSIKKI